MPSSVPRITTLKDARRVTSGASCWVLTDGKAGDLAQCLGVAERLELDAESRIIAPRIPYSWFMPWGPIDPTEAPGHPGSPLAPPFPAIIIASGRRTVPYLRFLKRATHGRSLTVFLKDPRSGAKTADLIWVPAHDRLRGANVLVTPTSPHRISPEALAAARETTWPFNADPREKIGLLVGGDSAHFRFSEADIARFIAGLSTETGSHRQLIATLSRRTPPALAEAIRHLISRTGGYLWNGKGENPYLAILAAAQHLIATADSVNMVGEAVATGKPVHLFHPTGGSRKIDHFLGNLERLGAIRPFEAGLEPFTYDPIDATPELAIAIARAYAARKDRES